MPELVTPIIYGLMGITSQTLTTASPGNYTVTVTDAFGCSASDSMMVIAPLQHLLVLLLPGIQLFVKATVLCYMLPRLS
ncbi:MAG: hypothetical protein IPL74_14980 [Bacteroidetes bacterium]|nr:hypothetical protein [Bacteroidota bacterium]